MLCSLDRELLFKIVPVSSHDSQLLSQVTHLLLQLQYPLPVHMCTHPQLFVVHLVL